MSYPLRFPFGRSKCLRAAPGDGIGEVARRARQHDLTQSRDRLGPPHGGVGIACHDEEIGVEEAQLGDRREDGEDTVEPDVFRHIRLQIRIGDHCFLPAHGFAEQTKSLSCAFTTHSQWSLCCVHG